jgi:hypothetical protein
VPDDDGEAAALGDRVLGCDDQFGAAPGEACRVASPGTNLAPPYVVSDLVNLLTSWPPDLLAS